MTAYNKTLKLIAVKLGLGEEDKVISKAAEFERLLQTKSAPGSIMTDTSKIVICLDLAAAMLGSCLDNKTVVKYSGLKGPGYANCKKIVENLLEINNNKLTVPSLCLTLQCSGIQDLAERILEEYRHQAKTEIDLDLPQYACMAVYQACRASKKKITKSKIIEKSRLKPAQWAKLVADWTKFVDEKFASLNNKKNKGKSQKNVGSIDDNAMEVEPSYVKEEKCTEHKIEPYEEWKRRMLEEAYKELEMFEKKEKEDEDTFKEHLAPRRSPRKTSQNVSPFKSPIKSPRKGSGIRLLFPKDD